MDFTFDSTLNRAGEIFHNIYDPVANRTIDYVGNTFYSILNRTGEVFHNIYDPAANHTNVNNISDDINNIMESNVTADNLEKVIFVHTF